MSKLPWFQSAKPSRATEADFARAARQIGTGVAEIKAVWQVEAAGRPFRADGSVERRFEPHHFPREHWADIGFEVRPGEAPWRASLRLSNEAMFQRAYAISPNAALRSTSWGGPQIMGFNHEAAGFITPEHMVRAMASGEAKHLDAFTALIIKWGLDAAIRAHDWTTFARRYNGSGQVERYAGLLQRAFGVTSTRAHAAALETASREHTGAPSPVVLRLGNEGPSVRRLQRALGIAEDGIFGTETHDAVIQFQRRAKLPEDGVVGARTWAALAAQVSPDATQAVAVQDTTAVDPERLVPIAGAVAAISASSVSPAVGITLGILLVAIVAYIIWKRDK